MRNNIVGDHQSNCKDPALLFVAEHCDSGFSLIVRSNLVVSNGGRRGLVGIGPLNARFGRRRTFIWFRMPAFRAVPVTCYGPQTYQQLLCMLPIFGFFTLGTRASTCWAARSFSPSLKPTSRNFPNSVESRDGLMNHLYPFLTLVSE